MAQTLDSTASESPNQPPRKRVRLSRACNACRSRKVRCDEQQPACSRCVAAGIVCTTSDPKSTSLIPATARRRAGHYATQPESAQESSRESISRRSTDGTAIADQQPVRHASEDRIHNDTNFRSEPGPLPLDPSLRDDSAAHDGAVHHHLSTPFIPSFAQAGLQDAEPNGEAEAESPEYAFNSTGQLEHKYLGPSSLQVFTQWLEMTFRIETSSLTERFRYGMRHCEELDIPDSIDMPQLPAAWEEYVQVYFDEVAPLFPVVKHSQVRATAALIASRAVSGLPQRQRPSLALLYACLAVGIRQRHPLSSESARYLRAASSLFSFLVAYPYVESAQALLMLTIALRCHSKDGAASQCLGLAIRIAQSIGLHRQASINQVAFSAATEHHDRGTESPRAHIAHVQEVWWSAYCLERISCLESGRPTSINDEDVDQNPLFDQRQAPLQAFMISLAKIQGDVSRQMFSNYTRQVVNSPRDMFHIQSRLDRQLSSWYADLPQQLRLDGELLTSGSRTRAARAFLLLQYYSTLATVHRSALLINQHIHVANLKAADLPPEREDRLLESKNVCISSAREIIRSFLEVLERNTNTAVISMTQPLMAIYILAIKNLRDPGSWMARSDLSLLHSATEAVEGRYKVDGQDPGLYFMLKLLQQFATARESAPVTQPATGFSHATVLSADGQSLLDPTQEWNSLFPRLFLGDLPLEHNDTHQDDIFGLMDIPQLMEEEIMSFSIMPGFSEEGAF
ncbi:hypothetical protein KVT40_004465 [Elsinoe batatas]|uniref:Zn(2)-C6 fungal-type domain-containing protein n=1 Tax=Elsinoe batatas TaxID=2601811 RepID=A0A8K0PHJ1_9PEZI|nr:hypothetical protein KVT40_004465 [Elsinoe batatas]